MATIIDLYTGFDKVFHVLMAMVQKSVFQIYYFNNEGTIVVTGTQWSNLVSKPFLTLSFCEPALHLLQIVNIVKFITLLERI